MSDQKNDIEKLIRLKRYEQPREGYFDDFLTEFQSRQRSELLRRSAHGLFFERVGTYFSGFSRRQWVYAGSAAYAAVTIGFFLVSGMGSDSATPGSTTAAAANVANVSNVAAVSKDLGDKHVLWDEPTIILVEDDHANEQIASRHEMSKAAEWDPSVLPAGFRGGSGVSFVPVKSEEEANEPRPLAVPPVGLEL